MRGIPDCIADTYFSSKTIPFKSLMDDGGMGAGTYGVCTCFVILAFFFFGFSARSFFFFSYGFLSSCFFELKILDRGIISVSSFESFQRQNQLHLCNSWLALQRFDLLLFLLGSLLSRDPPSKGSCFFLYDSTTKQMISLVAWSLWASTNLTLYYLKKYVRGMT